MDNSEPAFPLITKHRDGYDEVYSGLTMRDYFAAKSLTLGGEFFHNLGNGCDTPETVAAAAYQIADALLKARTE